jgi:hypothetical protein
MAIPYRGMNDLDLERGDVPLDLAVDDVTWAADLVDTYRAGDIDTTVAALEEMLGRLRKAAKARRMLGSVDPVVLRDALGLVETRTRA